MKDRNEILLEKERVDSRLAKIKADLLVAKANGARGIYMKPADFARLELSRSELAIKSQSLQRELGAMKKEPTPGFCPTCGRANH